jgi:hypothetical protein
MKANLADIGFAIRDFLEDQEISTFSNIEFDPTEHKSEREITHIDVSDNSRPIIHLDNGQEFLIEITEIVKLSCSENSYGSGKNSGALTQSDPGVSMIGNAVNAENIFVARESRSTRRRSIIEAVKAALSRGT